MRDFEENIQKSVDAAAAKHRCISDVSMRDLTDDERYWLKKLQDRGAQPDFSIEKLAGRSDSLLRGEALAYYKSILKKIFEAPEPTLDTFEEMQARVPGNNFLRKEDPLDLPYVKEILTRKYDSKWGEVSRLVLENADNEVLELQRRFFGERRHILK